MRLRWMLARLHWWSGLVVTPVLLAVALSGALLAVAPWLLATSEPAPRDPRMPPLRESELLRRAAWLLTPGDDFASIEWGAPGRAQRLTLRSAERWFVDPATGAQLGRRLGDTRLERVIATVHEFHVRLLAGPAGQWMVDLASVVALFMAASGLGLWWRTKRVRIAAGARGRRWHRDLHDATGFYASLVIVALALSGVLLAWEEPLYWLAGAAPEREPAVPHSHLPEPGARPTIGVDQWIAAATRALPGMPVEKLLLPTNERSPVAVELGRTDRAGHGTVWLDRWNANVLRVDDFRTAPRAYRAHVLDRAVHTGALAGAPTMVAALLGSLALAALAVTSIVSWLMRPAKARQRAAARTAQDSA